LWLGFGCRNGLRGGCRSRSGTTFRLGEEVVALSIDRYLKMIEKSVLED